MRHSSTVWACEETLTFDVTRHHRIKASGGKVSTAVMISLTITALSLRQFFLLLFLLIVSKVKMAVYLFGK